jgi:hypothetical protein
MHAERDETTGDDPRRSAMTSTLTPPPPVAVAPLGADDRCDRCNAAGKLRLTITGDRELVFCGHHANRYADTLAKITVRYWADPDFQWRGAELVS